MLVLGNPGLMQQATKTSGNMQQPCPPEKALCESVALGDLIANTRGGKAASIQPPIRLTLTGVTTPFPVSSFDGTSSRRSFEIRTTPELRDFCVRVDAKLQPMGKALHCSNYNSLLKSQKGDYEPLFRTKITIDETGKSPTKFFEAGTKRRMSNAEVAALDWKECSFNVLLRISSIYVNAGTFGPVATPEAIVVKREDIFPEALDDDPCCDPREPKTGTPMTTDAATNSPSWK